MQQPREHVGVELNVLCDKCSVMDGGGGSVEEWKKNVKCGENEERQLCQMRHTSKLFSIHHGDGGVKRFVCDTVACISRSTAVSRDVSSKTTPGQQHPAPL